MKKLEKKQGEIAAFEQDMIKQLQEREQKELQPILNEVNDAIKAVAKENGFQFIFEKKTLLYFEDSMRRLRTSLVMHWLQYLHY